MTTQHYFSAAGEYGDAQNLIQVDTTRWTADDWDRIQDAHESDRLNLARDIAAQRSGACPQCGSNVKHVQHLARVEYVQHRDGQWVPTGGTEISELLMDDSVACAKCGYEFEDLDANKIVWG